MTVCETMLNKQNTNRDNENYLYYCSRNSRRMRLNSVRINKSSFTSFGNLNVGRVFSKMNFVLIKWTDRVKNKEVLHTASQGGKQHPTFYKKEG